MDLLKESELGFIPKWKFVVDHAKQSNTKGPYINGLTTETLNLWVTALRGHELVGALGFAKFIIHCLAIALLSQGK